MLKYLKALKVGGRLYVEDNVIYAFLQDLGFRMRNPAEPYVIPIAGSRFEMVRILSPAPDSGQRFAGRVLKGIRSTNPNADALLCPDLFVVRRLD